MKTIKRIFTLLLAVMLIASFTVTAFAEEESGDNNSEGGSVPDGSVANIYNTGSVDGPGNSSSTPAAVTDTKAEESASTTATQPIEAISGVHLTTGPVKVNDDTSTYAVSAYAEDSSEEDTSTSVKVNGDVSLNVNSARYSASAVGAFADKGDATVDVTGSVSITQNTSSTGAAVSCDAYDGNTATVTVEGDVTAVDNGVSLTTSGISAYASSFRTDMGGVSVVDIGGSVYGEDTGISVTVLEEGSVTVNAANVSSRNTGIAVNMYYINNNDPDIVNITVGSFEKDGRLKDGTGVVTGGIDLSNSLITGENTQITLWKVDTVTGSACDDAINYIVRIAENSIKAIEAGGEVSTNSQFTTAKLGAEITVQPKSGYKVTSVSNNGNALKQLDNGSFSFTFKKNDDEDYYGGILLSAVFEKLPDPVKPTPAAPSTATTCKLTFELGGGTIDGESEYSKTYSYGQHIKLPIPEKEGCTFGGWETMVRGKTVTYEGGARYTVTAAKTFTAIWIEE